MRDPLEGVSPTGTIVTGVRRDRVAVEFELVLAAASELVQAHSDKGSLYLYGSVATGQAQVTSSDVDLFTIGVRPDASATMGRTLSRRFSGLCRAVEVGAGSTSDYLGDSDAAYGNRVFLHHYAVRISGPPPPVSLHDYPADARAARGFNGDIAIHAERWRLALRTGENRAELARRVARKALVAVAGLVSVHDRIWTTDRASAARRWAEVHPELARDLSELVLWMDDEADPTHAELARILDGPVAELVNAFRSNIGLWR